jgi:hypothetical protein
MMFQSKPETFRYAFLLSHLVNHPGVVGEFNSVLARTKSQPAQKPRIKAARTRFDEFQALHIYLTDGIHFVVSNFICLQKRYLLRYFIGSFSSLASTFRTHLRRDATTRLTSSKTFEYWDWTVDADGSNRYVPLIFLNIYKIDAYYLCSV